MTAIQNNDVQQECQDRQKDILTGGHVLANQRYNGGIVKGVKISLGIRFFVMPCVISTSLTGKVADGKNNFIGTRERPRLEI